MISFKVLVVVCLVGSLSAEEFDYSSSNYKAPPPAIILHKQALSKDGNFNFVFTSENGLKQGETIRPDGTRQGGYSYVDPEGKTITVKYVADKNGFRILEGNVPRAPEQSPQYEQIVNQHQQIRQQLQQSARDAYDKPIGNGNTYQQPIRSGLEQASRNPFESVPQPKPIFEHQPSNRPGFDQPLARPGFDQPLLNRPTFDLPLGRPGFDQPLIRPHGYQQQPARNSLDDGSRSAPGLKSNYRVQESPAPQQQVQPQQQQQYRPPQNEHKGPHSWGSGYAFEFSG